MNSTNQEVELFLQLLEKAELIERQDFASLEVYPTPEDILDALLPMNVSQAKLTQIYAKFRNLPFVQINSIDPKAIEVIDRDLARRFGFIPFFIDETHKILQVAITDPRKYMILNRQKLDELGNKLGLKIEVMMAAKDQVESALSDEKPEMIDQPKTENIASDKQSTNLSQNLQKAAITLEDLKNYSSSNDTEKLLDAIIVFALEKKASDIHLEPFEKTVRVRLRIDGIMEEIISLPSSQLPGLLSRSKLLGQLKIEEQRVPQDGRFDITVANQLVNIRVSTLPTVFGEKITMRLLPKTEGLSDLKTLGLDGLGYDRLIKAVSEPYGVIIVTGPTGSGKTTTIYSLLAQLNKPEVDIITLEDTIEYELPRVNQVRLAPHLGFGYAEGLRSVLKQDPNIIMVGEILDRESAELVIHVALTGRLVLTTLHTNDSSETLPRLFKLGVDPFLLTSAVKAVVAQRLVRKLCQNCKEEAHLPQAVLANVKKELEGLNLNMPITFYKSKGCDKCKDGYSGRIGIFEVLQMNSTIEELVLNKKSPQEILAGAKSSGFISMRQDGLIKALKGLTTVDEVVRATTMAEG